MGWETVKRLAPADASLITPAASETLITPDSPVDGQMFMWEIRPTAAVTMTMPAGARRVQGIAATLPIAAGGIGWVGARYSSTASAWTVLSAVVEV